MDIRKEFVAQVSTWAHEIAKEKGIPSGTIERELKRSFDSPILQNFSTLARGNWTHADYANLNLPQDVVRGIETRAAQQIGLASKMLFEAGNDDHPLVRQSVNALNKRLETADPDQMRRAGEIDHYVRNNSEGMSPEVKASIYRSTSTGAIANADDVEAFRNRIATTRVVNGNDGSYIQDTKREFNWQPPNQQQIAFSTSKIEGKTGRFNRGREFKSFDDAFGGLVGKPQTNTHTKEVSDPKFDRMYAHTNMHDQPVQRFEQTRKDGRVDKYDLRFEANSNTWSWGVADSNKVHMVTPAGELIPDPTKYGVCLRNVQRGATFVAVDG
jgi:hypothetical protein